VTDAIPPSALKTGFLARFVCVNGYDEPRDVVPDPWIDAKLEREVTNSLHELSLLQGKMLMPTNVQEHWIAWYFRHKARFADETSERMRAFLERKHVFLLRLAMLISVSENARLEFTLDAFEKAEEKLNMIEKGLFMIYEQIEASTLGKEQVFILGIIASRREGISHADLLAKVATKLEDATIFKKILLILIESKKIIVSKTRGGELLYKARRVE